jgi:hypothetical protein
MVARVAIVVGAERGLSSAGAEVPVNRTVISSALRTPGEIIGRPTGHFGSAFPESMASPSGNGRAGRLFHGVWSAMDPPASRPSLLADMSLSVFRWTYTIRGRCELTLCRSSTDISQVNPSYFSGSPSRRPLFLGCRVASRPSILSCGRGGLSLAEPSPANCQVPASKLYECPLRVDQPVRAWWLTPASCGCPSGSATPSADCSAVTAACRGGKPLRRVATRSRYGPTR